MKRIVMVTCFLCAGFGVFAQAQQYNGISVNVGFLEGRPATALGHDFHVGVNLTPWMEAYFRFAESQKKNYPDQGAINNLKDLSEELGFDVCRPKRIRKFPLCVFFRGDFIIPGPSPSFRMEMVAQRGFPTAPMTGWEP